MITHLLLLMAINMRCLLIVYGYTYIRDSTILLIPLFISAFFYLVYSIMARGTLRLFQGKKIPQQRINIKDYTPSLCCHFNYPIFFMHV
jgi:hypothetical protein